MIVTKRPDMSTVKWSKARKAQRERLKQANKYAWAAMADPDVWAVYEKMAAKEHRVPYRVGDRLNGSLPSFCLKGKNVLSCFKKSTDLFGKKY
jgi:hypothetical protein